MRTEAVGTVEKDAEVERRAREYALNHLAYRSVEPIRLKAYLDEHLELAAGRLAPRTLGGQRSVIRHFVAEIGEARMLESIRPRDVERWLAARLKAVKPATANHDLRTLRGIFERGIARGYLRENPFRAVDRMREPEKEPDVLSTEEIVRLIQACPDERWRAFVVVALCTGMRSAELCYLEWDDIDLEGGTVIVKSKAEHVTKSRKNRLLPLADSVVTMLRALPRTDRYVFPAPEGGAWNSWRLLRAFKKVTEDAGLTCTVKVLRATCSTHLENLAVAQYWLGHASITTTRKNYTRVLPASVREAAGRIRWLREPAVLEIVQKSYRGPVEVGPAQAG